MMIFRLAFAALVAGNMVAGDMKAGIAVAGLALASELVVMILCAE